MGLITFEDCKRIHEAALEVLWDVGVRVDDPDVVRLLRDAGARVTGGNVTHLHADLVRWALERCPAVARFADRRGRTWELGPSRDSITITGNALYITRGRTRSDLRSADLVELARLVDACEHGHGQDQWKVTHGVFHFFNAISGGPHHLIAARRV